MEFVVKNTKEAKPMPTELMLSVEDGVINLLARSGDGGAWYKVLFIDSDGLRRGNNVPKILGFPMSIVFQSLRDLGVEQ